METFANFWNLISVGFGAYFKFWFGGERAYRRRGLKDKSGVDKIILLKSNLTNC